MRLKLHVVPWAMLAASMPVGAAHAGAVSAAAGQFAAADAAVIRAASGPCRWRKGQLTCRAGRSTSDGAHTPNDYFEHDANKLPFGTERWRDQMRRENRLGNPG